MLIIGEKIYGARKEVAEAIRNRDGAYIRDLARQQFEAGAKYLDVNAGTPPQREPEDLVWLIEQAHQAAPEAVICLDSPNPAALAAGLAGVRRWNPPKVMLNGLSGEKNRLEEILPLAVGDGSVEMVLLALDDRGIPETAAGRLEIVRKLVYECRHYGLAENRLYVDPLVMSLATNSWNGRISLETMRAVKTAFPGVHLTCGPSNLSFGLPLRSVLNQALVVLALGAGLDSVLCDPSNRDLKAMILAAEAVIGQDGSPQRYAEAFENREIGPLSAL